MDISGKLDKILNKQSSCENIILQLQNEIREYKAYWDRNYETRKIINYCIAMVRAENRSVVHVADWKLK